MPPTPADGSACANCEATVELVPVPGLERVMMANVYHDDDCPTLRAYEGRD